MTHDEMIEVIQAHKDGREIEVWSSVGEKWMDCVEPYFNFSKSTYRIKPPQIEAWGVVSDGRLIIAAQHQLDRFEYQGSTLIRLIPDTNWSE